MKIIALLLAALPMLAAPPDISLGQSVAAGPLTVYYLGMDRIPAEFVGIYDPDKFRPFIQVITSGAGSSCSVTASYRDAAGALQVVSSSGVFVAYGSDPQGWCNVFLLVSPGVVTGLTVTSYGRDGEPLDSTALAVRRPQ